MSVSGKRKFPNIIEQIIASKSNIKEITANTFRSDASAILESLVAEYGADEVVKAMNHQGFEGKAYLSAISSLATVAKERRPLRQVGSEATQR